MEQEIRRSNSTGNHGRNRTASLLLGRYAAEWTKGVARRMTYAELQTLRQVLHIINTVEEGQTNKRLRKRLADAKALLCPVILANKYTAQ